MSRPFGFVDCLVQMIIIVELATIWAHLATPKALALDLNGNRHIFHYFMRFFDISSDFPVDDALETVEIFLFDSL